MKRILLSAAIAIAAIAATSPAHANKADKPGNCMIYAQEAAKTAKADPRITGADEDKVVAAFEAFARGQEAAYEEGLPAQIEYAKAFGYTEERLRAETEAASELIRKGFVGQTMEPGKLYTDHLLVLMNCGQRAKTAEHLGQSPEAFSAALDTAYLAVK